MDSNGDWSMSRLTQFLIVTGGLVLTGLAIYFDRAYANEIFWASAAASGAVAWNSRTQEAKENIVDKSAPDPDVKTEVKA